MDGMENAVNENDSKEIGGTTYVVIKWESDDEKRGFFVVDRNVKARSANEAISLVAKPVDDGKEFVAIPARSFKPVTVKVEQTTRVRVGA
jgi:hypothetical protein